MNRPKKCCVYRDCIVNSQTHPELTLFQFPKSEERAAKWSELGLVDPTELRLRYMCELHFPRIYMCFSSRRKMLLSTAMPHAYGTCPEGEQEVQSSSMVEEEEHLDESMIDENDDVATEIVYVQPEADDPNEGDELIEPLPIRKRSSSTESPVLTKIIKVEKMPAISHSMLVSSSSSSCTPKPWPLDDGQKFTTPPKGAILRRVKLKKRPSESKTIVINKTSPSSAAQSTTTEATAVSIAESALSCPPEKKTPSNSDSEAFDKVPPKEVRSPKKAINPVAISSSSSTVVKTNTAKPVKVEAKPQEQSCSPVKKDESVYEFIFKGEEYLQLPKAKYYEEQKLLREQLEQCEGEKIRMQQKVEYYRRTIGELKKLLANVKDGEDDETDE
ncbi:AAEL010817-PA [Aedes aegypti]|uniref:AAEL010817-PA n=2 Tax=Aedes aegypti TaxID=7159 RepID=A0A1S4FRQ7_AEDAE|nr:uncharacterized protein LOC5573969 [Aedes aegypti]EAT37154.1 AAEL010817-PA [Aedes aegypti]